MYYSLRDRIQYCEMKPGEIIDERTLIEEYGVSRTPIREALNMLYREHLVDIFPQSGTFVSKINLGRVSDLVFARSKVEDAVYAQLAQRKDPLNSAVDRILTLEELAMKDRDWREVVKRDYQFHKELFQIAGHAYAWEIIEEEVLPYYTRIRFFSESAHFEYVEYPRTHDEHLSIAKYIREGNMEQLRKAAYSRHYGGFNHPQMKEVMKRMPECFSSAEL